jgi:integrase
MTMAQAPRGLLSSEAGPVLKLRSSPQLLHHPVLRSLLPVRTPSRRSLMRRPVEGASRIRRRGLVRARPDLRGWPGPPYGHLRLLEGLQGFAKKAGIPDCRLHDLRHGVASALIDQGEDLKTVSDWLGHSDPAFTARQYVHISDAKRRRAADALAQAFGRSVDREAQ